MRVIILFLLLSVISKCKAQCRSVTQVSGKHAPRNPVCSGALIFEDDFRWFNNDKWKHENTLSGNGNWEFQWYTNDETNSYVENGSLYIRPTLLSEQFGEAFLTSGNLNLNRGNYPCTNSEWYGCERTGTPNNLINPIKSAKITTKDSFRFRYGKVEVRAKMPLGDWLWPAIWLLPAHNTYGTWPASGEIDMVETRGNRNYYQNGKNIGVTKADSTLHFGPSTPFDAWPRANFHKDDPRGFHAGFRNYQLEWTPNYIKFAIDGEVIGQVTPSDGGFWQYGDFNRLAPNTENKWNRGSKMAPFDQEFYLIINLAVGGINFFPEDAVNPDKKPWNNFSPVAMKEFYGQRDKWLNTWNYYRDNGKSSSLQVDYVKVWAL